MAHLTLRPPDDGGFVVLNLVLDIEIEIEIGRCGRVARPACHHSPPPYTRHPTPF